MQVSEVRKLLLLKIVDLLSESRLEGFEDVLNLAEAYKKLSD